MRRAVGLWAVAGLAAAMALTGAPRASAAPYHVEYSFRGGKDGAAPQSALIKLDGKLYGTDVNGGASNMGTVFSYDPATGAETTLYAFKGGVDGADPYGALIAVGGKLYGATQFGGGANCSLQCGTVFSLDPATGLERVVHAFGPSDSYPGALIAIGKTLYGTAYGTGVGAAFSIDLASGTETTLHVFRGGSDGQYPVDAMIEVGSLLYGVTVAGGGGSCGCGTVFSIDPASGHETVVYAFKGGADGATPHARLIAAGGLLYGTTDAGGAAGDGTVFSLDPVSGVETVLWAFQGGTDGAYPFGASVVMVGGDLYGVTFRGGGGAGATCGTSGCGTVFSLNPATGAEQVLHAFTGGRAAIPTAGLLYANRRLFGSTAYGGHDANCFQGCGALFSIRP